MATVLVTRPDKDAGRTAERLRAEGHEAIVSPVLTVAPVEAGPPAGRIDAVIVASANVAPWMARADIRAALADRPVFAVGDHAAEAIRAAGYGDVRSASGASSDLAQLAARGLSPPARLLAPVGRTHRAEAFELLRGRGFLVEPLVVYDAAPAEQLAAEAVAGLRYDVIDAALHYSPRSARVFAALADSAGAGDKLARLRHVCLSGEVADALPEPLRATAAVAAAPNEDALFAALAAALADAGEDEEPAQQRARRGSRVRSPRVIDGDATRVADAAPSGPDSPAASVRPSSEAPAAAISPPIGAGGAPVAATPADEIAAPSALVPEIPAPPGLKARTAPDDAPPPRPAATDTAPPPRAAAGPSEPPTSRPPRGDAPRPASPPPRRAPVAAALLLGALAGAVAGFGAAFLPSRLFPAAPSPPPIDAATLDARVAPLASRGDLAAAQQKIDALAGATERDRAALGAAIDALGQRIDGVAASLTALSAATAAANDPDLKKRIDDALQSLHGVAQRMQTIETKTQDIERAQTARSAPSADTATRRHALATALTQALARGAPYAAELDALASLGSASAAVDALRPFAASGAPSARALADSLAPLAPQILKQPAAQGSFVERLAASARGLVRVRPLGEPAGDDPAALVARIEAALVRGAIGEARVAFDRIPESRRAPAAAWGESLRRRADAGAAAQALLDEAARALAAPSK